MHATQSSSRTACWDWKWWSCVCTFSIDLYRENAIPRAPILPSERQPGCHSYIAFAAAAGVDYHSISFTIYISVVSALLRSCAPVYFVSIIIIIIIISSLRSCRGSLNRSMCSTRNTEHVFRHLSFSSHRFLTRALSIAFASIQNHTGWGEMGGVDMLAGARFPNCVLSLLFLWEDVVPYAFILLMGIAYTRFFKNCCRCCRSVACQSTVHAHTALLNLNHRPKYGRTYAGQISTVC